jgi:hypothetical protein
MDPQPEHGPVEPNEPLPAGDFGSWVAGMQEAIDGRRGSDVPCGSCTACCTASQFVHIAPDEVDTLAHIPAELLFPAPRAPRGHVLLGYDERGHCPMLVDGGCSIYEHRPRTCRTYDCRVFAAADVGLDEGSDDPSPLIASRARRWQFVYATETDAARHDAVRAAASFLLAHPDRSPTGSAPVNATQRAVAAVEIHEAFLGRDEIPRTTGEH